MDRIDRSALDRALKLLGRVMTTRQREPTHLVICGGSALIALGIVTRVTKDVDVLATLVDGELRCARPLPDWLLDDASGVQKELHLPDNWLNDGPADENLFRLGLPQGLSDRLVLREFGPKLKISFLGRLDQIHFKLYAAAGQGGRHFSDLKKLAPAAEELAEAARWTFTQDSSEPLRQIVNEVLQALGHGNLSNQI